MSHRALQKALVTALHDETFVEAFHADPEGVLAPLGLDEHERAQLVAVDRRAFRTDPLRRRRVLRVLSEEYKASTTLALAETRSLAFADGFFASSFFRSAVAEDQPLALAFGDFLLDAARAGRLSSPQLPDVARLERLRASCRRDRHRPPPPGVGLAPGVAVGRFFGGVLETIQRLERYLFEIGLMPQVALCDDRPPPPPLPAVDEGDPAHLLFTPAAADVGLSEIDAALHDALAALATPRPHGAALQALGQAGVPAGRAPALLDALVAEGLVSVHE